MVRLDDWLPKLYQVVSDVEYWMEEKKLMQLTDYLRG